MLTHIVLYKPKPGVAREQIEVLLREARTRLRQVPGVANLKAGTSIYKEDPYQCALVMYFEDIAALDRYRVHPVHVKFVEEVVNPVVDEVRRLDYVEE
ncbi:MAG TPA: Dabb family protein [Acidobacteriota bacterium]|jgi:hypothetical protein